MKHDEFIGLFRATEMEISNFYAHIDKLKFYSALISIGIIISNMRSMARALEPACKGYKEIKSVFNKPKEGEKNHGSE